MLKTHRESWKEKHFSTASEGNVHSPRCDYPEQKGYESKKKNGWEMQVMKKNKLIYLEKM